MSRHDNRLLRDTVAKFWRILPVFDEEGFGYVYPMPQIVGLSVKIFAKAIGER